LQDDSKADSSNPSAESIKEEPPLDDTIASTGFETSEAVETEDVKQSELVKTAALNLLVENYTNLFLCYYNCAPNISTTGIDRAYSQCMSLVELSDTYGSLPVISPRVKDVLSDFRSTLYR
jgi:hypothetical protein